MNTILFRGTTVELKDINTQQIEHYLLAECFEEDYVFQIIRTDGYFRGALCGYIKKEAVMDQMKVSGISIDHLKRELRNNIVDFDVKEFRIVTI